MVGIVKAIAQDHEPKKSANDHPLDSVFNSQSKDNGGKEQNTDLDMMFYPGIQSIYILRHNYNSRPVYAPPI